MKKVSKAYILNSLNNAFRILMKTPPQLLTLIINLIGIPKIS